MPPSRKHSREEIIDTACGVIEKDGVDALNARRLASELNGSVQIIYNTFNTMDELNKEVYNRIYSKYSDVMLSANDEERPYLAKGIAYVTFARDNPEFYKLLFMRKNNMNIEEFMNSDKVVDKSVISSIKKKFSLKEKDLVKFHEKVWIFSHGLSCLLATKTIYFSDKEIKDILVSTVNELFIGFKKGK